MGSSPSSYAALYTIRRGQRKYWGTCQRRNAQVPGQLYKSAAKLTERDFVLREPTRADGAGVRTQTNTYDRVDTKTKHLRDEFMILRTIFAHPI